MFVCPFLFFLYNNIAFHDENECARACVLYCNEKCEGKKEKYNVCTILNAKFDRLSIARGPAFIITMYMSVYMIDVSFFFSFVIYIRLYMRSIIPRTMKFRLKKKIIVNIDRAN